MLRNSSYDQLLGELILLLIGFSKLVRVRDSENFVQKGMVHVPNWLKPNYCIMGATEDKMKGNWNQIKGQLKQKYADLKDDDLQYTEGKEEELIGRIQERTGQSKQKIKEFIDTI